MDFLARIHALPLLLAATGCFSEPDVDASSGAESGGDGSTTLASTTAPATDGSGETGHDTTSTTNTTTNTTSTSEGTSDGDSTSSTSSSGSSGVATMPCEDADRILFLQFEGAELVDSRIGVDNAPAGAVANPLLAGEYGPYTQDDRPQLLDLVRAHYSPFNVCVTDQSPAALDFDMLVVTSDTHDGNPNSLGFSDVDCQDDDNNNVGVLYLSDTIQIGPGRKAVAVSKFAASFYGLEPVGEPAESYPEEIMNLFVSETNNGATFTSECLPVNDLPECPPTDCPSGMQSSHEMLDAALGSAP